METIILPQALLNSSAATPIQPGTLDSADEIYALYGQPEEIRRTDLESGKSTFLRGPRSQDQNQRLARNPSRNGPDININTTPTITTQSNGVTRSLSVTFAVRRNDALKRGNTTRETKTSQTRAPQYSEREHAAQEIESKRATWSSSSPTDPFLHAEVLATEDPTSASGQDLEAQITKTRNRGNSLLTDIDTATPPDDLPAHSAYLPPATLASQNSEPALLNAKSTGIYAAPPTRKKSLLQKVTGAIEGQRSHKSLTRKKSLLQRVSGAFDGYSRHSSLLKLYDNAVEQKKERGIVCQTAFRYCGYVLILATIYFVFVGLPLWKGSVWWLWWVVTHKFVLTGGWAIVMGIAFLYAFPPLLILFEDDPPKAVEGWEPQLTSVALLIPCYKSADLLPATLEAALKTFPAASIYVLANGNSPTPLDKTADVCQTFGVNHTWTPIGSKIIAQFIGCYVAKDYEHVLLIDDDCLLPDNFPLDPVKLIKGKVKVVGYTIKSIGKGGTRGTLAQRAQDLEYKLSGLQRAFAGKVGSATFPHGAISLWDREFLQETFEKHPGFSVSEDWFFGHVARTLGSRIVMCTSVFVETETPAAIFWSRGGGERGGFGEMTIWKQRFKRWNFFFVNGMYWNMRYIIMSHKLGWWEIGAKIFVFQEVYETLLYLTTPFMLPVSFIVQPIFCSYLFAATFGMYLINTVLFNEIHLRRKNQRVDTLAVIYYMPYKLILTVINVVSCYWSIYKYASYFAQRHPKVIEDEKVIEVALRIEVERADWEREMEWHEGHGTLHTPAPSLRNSSALSANFYDEFQRPSRSGTPLRGSQTSSIVDGYEPARRPSLQIGRTGSRSSLGDEFEPSLPLMRPRDGSEPPLRRPTPQREMTGPQSSLGHGHEQPLIPPRAMRGPRSSFNDNDGYERPILHRGLRGSPVRGRSPTTSPTQLNFMSDGLSEPSIRRATPSGLRESIFPLNDGFQLSSPVQRAMPGRSPIRGRSPTQILGEGHDFEAASPNW